MALPVLVDAGLDPIASAMFTKNLATGRKRFIEAAASELAQMFLELPERLRGDAISRLEEATGLTPRQILRQDDEKVRAILARQSIRNLAEFRVIDEALNEERLVDGEAETAATLQAAFVRARASGA